MRNGLWTSSPIAWKEDAHFGLTVIDQFTRECLKLEAAVPMSGSRVVECLERVAELRGYPQSITVDNGTEFCSRAVDGWAHRKGVKLEFIRPGRPAENGFMRGSMGAPRRMPQHPSVLVD